MAKRTSHSPLACVCAALFFFACAAPLSAADPVAIPTPPPLPASPAYKDTSLSFEKRAADLVTYMTLEEKCAQLQVSVQANIRLGIPPCNWWTEGLHGVSGRGAGRGGFGGGGRGGGGAGGVGGGIAVPPDPANPPGTPVASNVGEATVFPDAMGMAAMWDPPLLHDIASAISDEARAKYVPGSQRSSTGLMLWCPTMNIARDPRWGRTAETFGEDPYLLSRLGVAYVQGIQGDDPKYLKAIATPKHFAVYNQEILRMTRNDLVSQRSLFEYYLLPFQACVVEGHAQSIMAAYNAINGVPSAANPWLLTDVLRNQWGFDGAVVSDSNAVMQIMSGHQYVKTATEAAADAINAGVDVITGSPPPAIVVEAFKAGLIKPEVLDRAVTRTLLVRFRLGLFDPPEMIPYTKISPSVVGSKEHSALALKSAQESIVLLKNDPAPRGFGFEQLLPLDLRRVNSIAVIGPYTRIEQYGSYGGTPVIPTLTPLEAITAAVGDRVLVRSANTDDEAVKAAADSDIAIIFAGLNPLLERTGVDRPTLDLPVAQDDLIQRVMKVNPLTILVLEGGSSIGLESAKSKVPAIMMLWYPGQAGSVAIAQALLGQFNPAGRLPLTFYRSYEDLPPMEDYEVMHGRTYMYNQKPVTFPFGHGLSYTTFSYANLKVEPQKSGITGSMNVTVDVTNTGSRDGEEVVQIYGRKIDPAIIRPLKQLIAFNRVNIPKGQTQQVHFTVPLTTLAFWDTDKKAFAIEPGAHEIMVGASSADIRAKLTVDLK